MRRPFYHLTREDREVIYEGITEGISLSDIALTLGKDPTTISREVKRNRSSEIRGVFNRNNICIHSKECTKSRQCKKTCNKLRCASCTTNNCNNWCQDFFEKTCKQTYRWPYVCNGCVKSKYCGLPRYFYRPTVADSLASNLKSQSRSGIILTTEELLALDALVSPLLKDNKHSVEVICSTLKDQIPVSPQTLRRYLEGGHTKAIRLDLISAPKRKVRKKRIVHATRHPDDGRSYTDFLELPEIVQANCWEIDTFFGSKRDRSCLLTMVNRQSLLFLAFKISACDAESVIGIFDWLEILCRDAGCSFEEVFEILLTDNGSEFSDAKGIETSHFEETKRCSLYYCDPYSSWQKPHIEGRHTLARRIIPKGTSLTSIGHDKVALMVSHINSYPSIKREGYTPYELSLKTIGKDLLTELGIDKVPYREVRLKRDLLDI